MTFDDFDKTQQVSEKTVFINRIVWPLIDQRDLVRENVFFKEPGIPVEDLYR